VRAVVCNPQCKELGDLKDWVNVRLRLEGRQRERQTRGYKGCRVCLEVFKRLVSTNHQCVIFVNLHEKENMFALRLFVT
jgi:hypothetical protein